MNRRPTGSLSLAVASTFLIISSQFKFSTLAVLVLAASLCHVRLRWRNLP